MPLAPGVRLGPYEVIAQLGVGGMGEVWRATDTGLGRQVAIKVLPDAFAQDAERLARFEREAKTLAALNHPNIASIYGLEKTDGARALVMELVEGPTLADRIARGPLPTDEALAVATQIADALEAAHEQGIIHRDLKPANIKVRADGTVKVLDFGLAKAMEPAAGSGDIANSPTITSPAMTQAGIILGTAAYMSPEQAKGRPADKRSDVWAFGCVLYEMVTGKRAFQGDGVSDTLANVLKQDPDWTVLPLDCPPPIRRLLRRCLARHRTERLSEIGTARLDIRDALESGPTAADDRGTRGVPRRRIALLSLAGVGILAGAGALAAWIAFPRPSVVPSAVSRFAIVPPPAQPLARSSLRDLVVSPDGLYLVYRSGGFPTGGGPLMLRRLDQLDARPLSGVTNAREPFFSSDGRWLGFFEGAELKKISVTGGPPLVIASFTSNPLGASWGDDDTIVFATTDPTTGLWRVAADGGDPSALTTPDNDQDHLFPSMLPGSQNVLFTIRSAADQQIALLDLSTGQHKTLLQVGSRSGSPTGSSRAEYVRTGHLVYSSADGIRAVPFDLTTLSITGESVPVVEDLASPEDYMVARAAGTLVYVPARANTERLRALVWVDRRGAEDPIKAPLLAYRHPRLSPDGRLIALNVIGDARQGPVVLVWDVERETLSGVTTDRFGNFPIWARDGRSLIFQSAGGALAGGLYSQTADGSEAAVQLTTGGVTQVATSITPDRQRIVGYVVTPDAGRDIVTFRLTNGNPAEPEPLIASRGDDINAEISPDGRYVAYQSNESGEFEVYVRPFPQVGTRRWQISTAGGTRPAWAPSGRELFYLDAELALTSVAVHASTVDVRFGNRVKVLDNRYPAAEQVRTYDVSPDGQRFLMMKDAGAGAADVTPASIVAVLNWFEELKRLMPTE